MVNRISDQSHKADLYSLAVTMLVVGEAGGFNEANIATHEDISIAKAQGLEVLGLTSLAPMLQNNPIERLSARDVFVSHWPHDLEAIDLVSMCRFQKGGPYEARRREV